jgi:CubicO group peptidase (beta-lactamase class C family)
VRPLVDGGLAPTLAVGILEGGATQIFAYGADEDALFEIGSITKVFTGTLLADMAREGLVGLGDPVAAHLPDAVTVPRSGERAITLLDLATHSSALPRLPANLAPEDRRDPYADYTADKLYAFLSSHTLARPPGASVEYSNLGMMLLGHALARRAGKSYEELVVERICAPLGMKDTVLAMTPEQRARLARGYDAEGNVAKTWTMALPGPGNLLSTAADLLRFLAANVSPPPTRLGLAMSDAQAMRFPMKPPAPVPIGGIGMGLGWVIGHGDVRWHNGGTGGYASFAAFDAKKKLAVVALCGTLSTKVDDLGYNLLKLAEGEDPPPPRVPVPVAVDPRVLESYAGKYALGPSVLTVTAKDGRLFARRDDQESLPIYPSSETRFFFRVVPLELSFAKGDDGEVDRVVVHAGKDIVARRVE